MRTLLGIVACLLFSQAALAGDVTVPEAHLLKKKMVFMNHISVDKVTKEVRINVLTALESGILEYLLVGNHGKTHETVFKLSNNRPSDLNVALLLIGCEPLKWKTFKKALEDADGLEKLKKKHCDSLLTVEINRGGKPVPMEKLMRDREGGQGPLTWVYTGGSFSKKTGRYFPDMKEAYMAIWPDPNSVVSLYSTHKNPYRGDFGFEINPDNKGMKENLPYEIILRKIPCEKQ